MELKIKNCNWAFKCPQNWENLKETTNSKVKFCNDCQKHVFLCEDNEAITYHSNRLHCIALNPTSSSETKWLMLGKYMPPEYVGPTMKIILSPTFSLDSDQIKFLVRSFELGKFELNWQEILCDGKEHTLKTGIPPTFAESLFKRLEDRNISFSFEIEPD